MLNFTFRWVRSRSRSRIRSRAGEDQEQSRSRRGSGAEQEQSSNISMNKATCLYATNSRGLALDNSSLKLTKSLGIFVI